MKKPPTPLILRTLAAVAVIASSAVFECDAALVGQWTFEAGSLKDTTGNFEDLVLSGDATISNGALDVNGAGTEATGWASTSGSGGVAIGTKTLVSWITLQSLSDVASAGSAMTIDSTTVDQFDGIVFAERDANTWMNGSNGFARTPASFGEAAAVETGTGSMIQLAITYQNVGGTSRITGYRNGQLMGTYDAGPFANWGAGNQEIIFGKRHLADPTTGPGALDALIHEARVYDTVLTQPEIQALQLTVNTDTDADDLPDQWEMSAVGNLTSLNGKGAGPGPGAGTGNLDGDGLLDKDEFTSGTNPNLADTDGDTLSDGSEVLGAGARPPTSPTKNDTDSDGLTDTVETNDGTFNGAADTGSNPVVTDSDGDGFADGLEVNSLSSNPLNPSDPGFSQTLLGHWIFEPGSELKDLKGNFPDLILEGNAAVNNGALDLNGSGTSATGWAHTGAGGVPIGSKTLVSWITLQGLEDVAKSGAAMALDSTLVDRFDGIVFAERNTNRWMNGSSNFNRTPPDQFDQTALSEETTTGTRIMLAITYEDLSNGDVQITGYRNGIEIGTYTTGNFATWTASEQEVLFGPRHTSPGPNGALDALVHEARLYGKAATGAEIMTLFTAGPVLGTDTDSDGLTDQWELTYAATLAALNGMGVGPGPGAGTGDLDGDGLLDINEQLRATNPSLPDTDGDTLSDNAEVLGAAGRPPTSPTKNDTDTDGLTDLVETNDGSFNGAADTGTNPTVADTDADGFLDGTEVNTLSSNPLNASDPGFSQSLLGHWTFEPGSELKDLRGNFPDIVLQGDATITDGALDVNGTGTEASAWAATSGSGGVAIGNKTLVSWITLQSLSDVAVAGSAMTLDSTSADKFDGIVFAERGIDRWMSGSNNFSRTPAEQFDQEAAVETTIGVPIMLAITYENVGGMARITGYRNDVVMGTYELGPFATWAAGDQEVIFGKRHLGSPTAGPGALDALIHEARLYGKAATAAEIAALFAAGPVAGEPLVFTLITYSPATGTAEVTWVSKPGKTYRLEYSNNLVTWLEETDSYPTGGATSVRTSYRFQDIPLSVRERFFKVTEE